ncbi:hypothetical protein [Arthrobacter agilis]|uniref:hypothetical protein n=1 Tax=Arthrobacter agilis TaxID=37921 RepID=UPI00278305F2|nr:hypothetical protein [Arthrobacter agilis]MDQ0735139.1 hypothetical protein [Arthrobacter agilis]
MGLMGLMGTAVELGTQVIEGNVEQGWGSWDHATQTMTLKPGMGKVQRRSVLARMLGHAALGHTEASPQAEAEAEAQAWAARQLISAGRVAATLKAVNWVGLLARELEVMPSDVAAYYGSLSDEERLGIRKMIETTPCGYPRGSG